jgi:hypothetical protein
MEKKRWDSMESWSMLLDTATGPAGEGSTRDSGRREEWMADLSQLFIGNKFASGANSRIYRGIYKQRAVAVKMVRIPERDEDRRAVLEDQFNSEVAFLSRLYHPNIVQVISPTITAPSIPCILVARTRQNTGDRPTDDRYRVRTCSSSRRARSRRCTASSRSTCRRGRCACT